MAGVREIKGRIKSVKDIQQITRAMKMVAAARIKKVETRMKASRPYAYKMQEVVAELTAQVAGAPHPLMEARPAKRLAAFVVSADKGLCGSYNNNLLRMAWNWTRALPADQALTLFAVGRKANRFFRKRGANVAGEYLNWSPDLDLAREMAHVASGLFIEGQADEVYAIYTHVKSALVQEPRVERILPLAPSGEHKQALPYIFEPDPVTALQTILPRYLEVLFFQMLLEARTAELGARLRAMSNATDNAGKLVGELTLDYFRARQAAITNEILEVAGGAEALKRA